MSQIPLHLARKLMYDVHADGCIACDLLGLPGVSREIALAEHAASTQRLNKVRPLFGTIEGLAELLGNLSVNAQLYAASRAQGQEVHVDPAQRYMHVQQHKEMVLGSVSSILAILIDEGLLETKR